MGDFFGTGIEIWAGFGPICSTEKKGLGQLRATFLGDFFKFSGAKKIKFSLKKPCRVRTKKLHKIK